jgi:hypothetical protein
MPISESIFDGKTTIIPLREVQFLVKMHGPTGVLIGVEVNLPQSSTTLFFEEADSFLKAWCQYRHEHDGPFIKLAGEEA